jgi:hypothetical protein
MYWKKIGQIYTVNSQHPLTVSHASNPLALHLEGDVFRIFFSARDATNKSSVTYADINIETHELVYDHQKPLITYGPEDSFYSHGLSIGNLYQSNNQSFIGFMAWQIRGKDHWRGEIGRLELINKDQLILNPNSAFMGSDSEDPISLSFPFVLFDEGLYKMWYGSTIDWNSENGEMIHVIKYATSKDGENWIRHGIAVPFELGVAQAFSRPAVLKRNNSWHMWFSYRSGDGTPYRIGYARSLDGSSWTLDLPKAGIDVSTSGWDSEMICYPFLIEHKQNTYMLYNGNSYGKDGFGIAIFES